MKYHVKSGVFLVGPLKHRTLAPKSTLLPIALAQRTNVTRFNPKPGIYYESIGTGRMATSDWTIVAFYDLEPYWADLKTFSDGVVKVGE